MSCGKFVETNISMEEIEVIGDNKCLLQNLCNDLNYSFHCIKPKVLFANIQYNDKWFELFPPKYKDSSQLIDKIFSFEIVIQQKETRNDSLFGKTFGVTKKKDYSFTCYCMFIHDINTPTTSNINDFKCWIDSIIDTIKQKHSMYKNIPTPDIKDLNSEKIHPSFCVHLSENKMFIKNINIIEKQDSEKIPEQKFVPGFSVNMTAGSKKRKNKKTKTRKNKKRKSKKNHK